MVETDIYTGGGTCQTLASAVPDSSASLEKPVIAKQKDTGEIVWLKVIQDIAENMATGITALSLYDSNAKILAVGGHETLK
jgi:hypothetical protein